MSNNKAFIFEINPFTSIDSNFQNSSEDGSVHQSSPTWVLTFIRWENRDTFRVKNIANTSVRDPLVVENDCVQISVSTDKGTLTPSMNATLLMTDVNYETAVAPGDFVMVNILNWESEARRVVNNAGAKLPINGPNDGFKGIFKIQSVRRVVHVDPDTGTKNVVFKITGFAFTEFNNTIYFEPNIINEPKIQEDSVFQSAISKDWKFLQNKKGKYDVQAIITLLIRSLIGSGIDPSLLGDKPGLPDYNTHFFMPSLVGQLLGVPNVKAAKDIYNYLFGIQHYASGTSSESISNNLNPVGLTKPFPRFFYTSTPCSGDSILKAEYWNQVKTWSILNQYTNAPLNELYTCFRASPLDKNNRIMPTVVFRQKPFTTEDFEKRTNLNLPVTKFLNLPRWKIHPALVTDLDIGRDESARINFVQYFGQSTVGIQGVAFAAELAQVNYEYDKDDVTRSGLRPYVVTTQFDEVTIDNKTLYKSPGWSKIMSDALIGGHLRLNGTIVCAGIVDPITVGDNLEFDKTVFHIEQVSHHCGISIVDGKKTFRTSISMSNGVSLDSNSLGTKYAEMEHTRAYQLRNEDFNNDQILPGTSDSQDIVKRSNNPEPTDAQIKEKGKPFAQPNFINKKRNKSGK